MRSRLLAEVAGMVASSAEARWIIEEVLGPPRRLESGGDVTEAEAAAVRALADRRRSGQPLQYVLGHWPFRHLDLLVDSRVLIPRPETEQVVDVALAELARIARDRDDPIVVDLGTGSGAIALAMASEAYPRYRCLDVWGTDVARSALDVATANRDGLGVTHPAAAERVRLRHGDWFDALPGDLVGRVDLVVANPPYVAEEEWLSLQAEVRREPYLALVAGSASDGTPGLGAGEAVLRGAGRWLGHRGSVVVEVAPHQSASAVALARAAGFGQVEVRKDLSGHDRAVVCRT